MTRLTVALIVALTGFINLSYEMLWVRVYGFAIKGAAAAFPLLLGAYLIGLALGSLASTVVARRLSDRDPKALGYIATFVGIGNVVGFLMVPLLSWMATWSDGPQMMPLLLPIVLASTALGVQFPLLSHYGVSANREAGMGVATLYVANIAGSVLGSLVTGFWLTEWLSTEWIAHVLLYAGVVATMLVIKGARITPHQRRGIIAGILLMAAGLSLARPILFDHMWDRLLFHSAWRTESPVEKTLENRVGVINVTKDQRVFSGGVYDGNFSVDLFHDKNGIVRPFALSAFHANPRRILYCGLGSGSWASVIASHPDAEEIVVVEINPAYVDIVRASPHAWMLKDPRVKIVIDDVRRYLRRNDQKFDAFVFNMTFHWRSLASTVLSQEFFALVRQNLNSDGVFMINSTGSPRVFKSAMGPFTDVQRFMNLVVASSQKMDVSGTRLRSVLERYKIEGIPVVPSGVEDRLDPLVRLIDRPSPTDDFQQLGRETREMLERKLEDVIPITDDNTGEEFTGF